MDLKQPSAQLAVPVVLVQTLETAAYRSPTFKGIRCEKLGKVSFRSLLGQSFPAKFQRQLYSKWLLLRKLPALG